MAILRNVNTSTAYFPAALEHNGKVYLEGQAHDITTLSPIFNDSLGFYATTANISNFVLSSSQTSRVWYRSWGNVNPNFGREKLQAYDLTLFDCGQNLVKPHITDSANNASLYIPSDYVYAGTSYIVKQVNQQTKSIGFSVGDSVTGVTDPRVAFVDQTSTNLILIKACNDTTANTSSLYTINKTNSGVVTIIPGNFAANFYGTLSIVDSTPTNLFVARQGPNSSSNTSYPSLTFNVYDRTQLTYTTPATVTNAIGSHIYPSKGITLSGTTKVFYRALPKGSTSGSLFVFQACQYDTSALTASITNITPTGDTAMPGQSSAAGDATSTPGRTWAFTVGSTIYVCVGVYSNSSGENTSVPIGQFYIHTYKTTTSNPTSLQYVSSTNLGATASRPLALIPQDSDFSKIIAPYNAFINFIQWNQASETYDIVSSSPISAKSILIDSTSRIWILDLNGSLSVLSPTIANTVNVSFENSAITFSGTIINTNLIVSAFNSSGSRIAANVLLNIDSNSAVFSDGTVSKTVTTSSSTDISVPIKITGAGYIRVYASVGI
jgi:hypothetical protein